MLRSFFLAAAFVGFAAAGAVAIPPDSLQHFHVLPRVSVLHVQGGFIGLDNRFRVQGEYDFLKEWSGGVPTDPAGVSPLRLNARFDNAEIWASPIGGPGDVLPAFVLDVDQILNLEGLRGEPVPSVSLFDVFRFDGRTSDGSRVELFTAQAGPWMYVQGTTTPPPGTADFFEYELRMLARTRPWADLNEDGVVDAADYTVARDLDPAMLADWREQFGEWEPDMFEMQAAMSAAVSAAQAIPEPGSLLLIALAATRVLGTRRSACRL